MAAAFVAQTAAAYGSSFNYLTGAAADGLNMVPNATFTTPGSGTPTGWVTSGGSPAATVSTITGDTSIKGDWLMVSQGIGTGLSVTSPSAAVSVVAGHLYRFSFRIQTTGIEAAGAKIEMRFWYGLNDPGLSVNAYGRTFRMERSCSPRLLQRPPRSIQPSSCTQAREPRRCGLRSLRCLI
jgi:hypothetical protein